MTAADTKRPLLRGAVRVIPWDAMTDARKHEHLRLMHGHRRGTTDIECWHRYDHDYGYMAVAHTHDKAPR